MEKLYRSSR